MPRRESLTAAWRANFLKHWLALLALLQLLLPAQNHLAAAAEPAWKSGAEFDGQLESLAGVRWGSNPLRAALTNLSRHHEVAIFLDRRVDPDQTIDLVIADTPLRELLQRLASQLKLGVGQVGSVIYLGPPPTAAVLGTVAALQEEQEYGLPSAVRSRLRRLQPLRWPELATPRDLIQRLADVAGLRVEGLEQVPHDLWPEADLPPLTFAQSLSLILAGFELTFEYAPDGSVVQLMPLPATASITRRIPLRGSPAAVGAEIRRRFPDARFTIEAGSIVVDSTVEVSAAIQRLLDGTSSRPKPPPAKAKGEKRYTLRVQESLGAVAAAVAKEVGVELLFAPGAEELRDKLVWLDVKEVTLDQLLRTLLEPGGLTYRLDEQTLEIRPANSP
jgi:hypothetical protein